MLTQGGLALLGPDRCQAGLHRARDRTLRAIPGRHPHVAGGELVGACGGVRFGRLCPARADSGRDSGTAKPLILLAALRCPVKAGFRDTLGMAVVVAIPDNGAFWKALVPRTPMKRPEDSCAGMSHIGRCPSEESF
jgi:hypothetical protein